MNWGLKQMRWLAVVLAGLALTSCSRREQPTPALETGKKILMAHYMPWFRSELGAKTDAVVGRRPCRLGADVMQPAGTTHTRTGDRQKNPDGALHALVPI